MEILLIFLEKGQSPVNKYEPQLVIRSYLVSGLIRPSAKYFVEQTLGIFRILLGVMQRECCYTSSKVVKSREVQSGFAAFGQQKSPNKWPHLLSD